MHLRFSRRCFPVTINSNLGVKLQEAVLCGAIKAIQTLLDRLHLVTEHTESANDVDQTTSRNNVLNRTRIERPTNHFGPLHQNRSESFIRTTESSKFLFEDLLLGLHRRKFLLQ